MNRVYERAQVLFPSKSRLRGTNGALNCAILVEYRIEKDSMGEMQVPADALYAAQTQRAVAGELRLRA